MRRVEDEHADREWMRNATGPEVMHLRDAARSVIAAYNADANLYYTVSYLAECADLLHELAERPRPGIA